MKQYYLLLLFFPWFCQAQENPLDIIKPLEGKTWTAEGTWGDGSMFKQEITVSFGLGDQLVIVRSNGFTDTKQSQFGPRNHGVRQYDSAANQIRFWEFDVFGQVTEGTVESEGRHLIYRYDYGGTLVTEKGKFRDEKTYDFIVGILEDKEWKQKFLETQFKAKD